jgi:hypothetical protein
VQEYDPLYVAARTVLLDFLETLGPQREAVILVGAQAVYMRTGDTDVAVAPYTTDAVVGIGQARAPPGTGQRVDHRRRNREPVVRRMTEEA